MTLAPTLYDFQVALSHVDRSIDQPQLMVKLARHPSETMQRAWLRVLAFCWLWEERLAFGKGLAEPDAPDIECRDYTGLVTSWVRVGKADPVKVQRAVDQNPHARVTVMFESPQRMEAFLAEAQEARSRRARGWHRRSWRSCCAARGPQSGRVVQAELNRRPGSRFAHTPHL
ncbi:hypothetical protein HPC49_17295 [Pyxidicoccus fallax]|uniref:YaeQ family protein n=1 Tax=Pyxidicoccus fallax TaxID=394095 RepID=A0A848LDC3_9BACT|nr:YaeQ family protein [Pyxidicoccus fallax]NMO14793.1 YaeQ family protein [Pyxidicoccus fallax]NPC79969.1 hypothetical protein [Pyxidicoccus fallax]